MANQIIFALPRVTDGNGAVAAGAKATFFRTGTTTPVTVYSDTGLTTAHPSPLLADAAGVFAQVYHSGATQIKVVVTDSADVALYQLDPAPESLLSGSAAESVTFSPITGNAATDVQDAIANNTTDIALLIPGTRTITAGAGLTGGGDLSANRTISLDLLDEDDFVTDSATQPPSQQSAGFYARAQAIGVGQTWQNVTGSRAAAVVYQNLTGKPIMVSIVTSNTTGFQTAQVSVDSATWITVGHTASVASESISFIVPDDWYYKINQSAGTTIILNWAELRA